MYWCIVQSEQCVVISWTNRANENGCIMLSKFGQQYVLQAIFFILLPILDMPRY